MICVPHIKTDMSRISRSCLKVHPKHSAIPQSQIPELLHSFQCLTLLHSERQKLYTILAFLSATGLSPKAQKQILAAEMLLKVSIAALSNFSYCDSIIVFYHLYSELWTQMSHQTVKTLIRLLHGSSLIRVLIVCYNLSKKTDGRI